MSELERNKGRLKYAGVDSSDFSEEEFEVYEENGFAVIDNEIYEVEWEVRRGYDAPEFAEVKHEPDGWISFHTYHHNGGAHWTEVVSEAMDELYKQELKDLRGTN